MTDIVNEELAWQEKRKPVLYIILGFFILMIPYSMILSKSFLGAIGQLISGSLLVYGIHWCNKTYFKYKYRQSIQNG